MVVRVTTADEKDNNVWFSRYLVYRVTRITRVYTFFVLIIYVYVYIYLIFIIIFISNVPGARFFGHELDGTHDNERRARDWKQIPWYGRVKKKIII